MKSEKIRVLVTGANGFLGSNILAAMMARPEIEPIAACRDRARLRPDFNGEVRVGDLVDASYRRKLVEDVDMICHAGSWLRSGRTNNKSGSAFSSRLATSLSRRSVKA